MLCKPWQPGATWESPRGPRGPVSRGLARPILVVPNECKMRKLRAEASNKAVGKSILAKLESESDASPIN